MNVIQAQYILDPACLPHLGGLTLSLGVDALKLLVDKRGLVHANDKAALLQVRSSIGVTRYTR